jgi:hypothetical protein
MARRKLHTELRDYPLPVLMQIALCPEYHLFYEFSFMFLLSGLKEKKHVQ